jgi:hypothetical protein
MVGGKVAGKTAVVFFRAHRFHFLAGFLSEGGGLAGFVGDRARKSPVFLGKPSRVGEKIKASSFCHSKRDELI